MPKKNKKNKSIRFPEIVIKEVQAIADREHRSFSSQVLYFIEKGLKEQVPA